MFKAPLKLPVVLVGLLMILMLGIDAWFITFKHGFKFQALFSLLVFSLGVLIVTVGGYAFKKANTTVNPLNPENTSQLVTSGVYSLSRNPMYVGFFLWLTASVIFIGNSLNLVVLPVYVVLANSLYILPEERALSKLFGKDFAEYKNQVRRWI